jgi:hypothetical protein
LTICWLAGTRVVAVVLRFRVLNLSFLSEPQIYADIRRIETAETTTKTPEKQPESAGVCVAVRLYVYA